MPHQPLLAQEWGKILDVYPSKAEYHIGEQVKIYVQAKNTTNQRQHYVVALEIRDPNDKVVYDSHGGSEIHRPLQDDIVQWLDSGEIAIFGPFMFTLTSNFPIGTYHIVSGLRVYPWDPVAQFRGLHWCPPEDIFEVYPAVSLPEGKYLPFTVEIKNRAAGSNAAFFTLSVKENESLYFFKANVSCPDGIIIKRIFPIEQKTIEDLIKKGAITIAGSVIKPLGMGIGVYQLFNEYFEEKRTTNITSFSVEDPLPGEPVEFLFWLSPTENWQDWKITLTTRWQKNPNETVSSDVKEVSLSN